MHEILKDRILRRLEALPEDRLYQALDYIEFLESKYAARQAPPPNVLQRFAEGIEDTLRAGNVSASTVAEAMGFMSKAMGVLSGVAAAGASVANDVVGIAKGKPGETTAPARRRRRQPSNRRATSRPTSRSAGGAAGNRGRVSFILINGTPA